MSNLGCGGSHSSEGFSQRDKQPGKEKQPGKDPGGSNQCGGSNVTVSGPLANSNYILKVEGEGVGNISICGRPKQQDKGGGSHSSGSSSQHEEQPATAAGESKVEVRGQVSNKNRMGRVRGKDVGNINISG